MREQLGELDICPLEFEAHMNTQLDVFDTAAWKLHENVDRTTAKDRMRKVMPEPAYFVIARVFHFRVGPAGFPTPAIF